MRLPGRVESVVTNHRLVQQRRVQRALPGAHDALTAGVGFQARAAIAEHVARDELRLVVEVVDEITNADLVVVAELLIDLEYKLIEQLTSSARNRDAPVGAV
jgi:hypothetical protein